MFEARGLQSIHQPQILTGLLVGVYFRFLFEADLFFERCFGFHGECVGRDVGYAEFDEGIDVHRPLSIGETGCSIDQIGRQVGEDV